MLIDSDELLRRMRAAAGCDTCESYMGVRCRACDWDTAMDLVLAMAEDAEEKGDSENAGREET